MDIKKIIIFHFSILLCNVGLIFYKIKSLLINNSHCISISLFTQFSGFSVVYSEDCESITTLYFTSLFGNFKHVQGVLWSYSPQISSCLLPLPVIHIFCPTRIPPTFMFEFFAVWGDCHTLTQLVRWVIREWRTYTQIQEIWDWVIWALWWRSHIPTLLITHPTTPPPEAQCIYYIQLNKEDKFSKSQ